MLLLLLVALSYIANIAICSSDGDIEYHIDPTHDVTCGFDKECIIKCETNGACGGRIFTFLNDWGKTETKHNVSLLCTGSSSCYNLVIVANTSSIYIDFEANDGWSMEAYFNFGTSSDDIQQAVINCNGEYSCESGSFIFNSMLDTDQESQEMETISNGIVQINCNAYGSCESLVVTAFQIWDLNVHCLAPHSCHSMTLYSPIKYHINFMDPNTNLQCNAIGSNGSYDGACSDIKIYNYAGRHLASVECLDFECGVDLYCGLMYEYECDYFKCSPASPCSVGVFLNDNQVVASPNQLVMDYTPNKYSGKEVYIYVSTVYEKFIYFYSKNSWLMNATYPIIYCPIDGSCNIICTDIGYGAHYDHCAYGIYYGNYSESMTVRAYEADQSVWYGATNLFWWKGMYGNQDITLDLSQTTGEIRIDCNGTSDTYSWGSYSGCQDYKIITASPELFEMNCHEYYACRDTKIYTDLGSIEAFPSNYELNCDESTNITDHTTCRGMNVFVGDGSGCEYAITTDNGVDEYWECIDWFTPAPTEISTTTPWTTASTSSSATATIRPTSKDDDNKSEDSWIIPLVVVIGLLLVAIVVFFVCKKFGKPQLSFMSANTSNDDKSQGFVGLDDANTVN